MAFSRTDNGIWCPGSSASAITTTINTINGGSTLDAGADVLAVTLEGYHLSAAGGDYSVEWGNGSVWETLTLGTQALTTGQLTAVFYYIGPTTTYDRFRINTTRAFTYGVSATFAAYSAAGTVTLIDSDALSNASGSGDAAVTLTGGASGDIIYTGGHDFTPGGSGYDLNQDSVTVIETEGSTACNSQHYGHAEKDWSAGATVTLTGYYPNIAAIAFNDDGAAAGNPYYYYASQ